MNTWSIVRASLGGLLVFGLLGVVVVRELCQRGEVAMQQSDAAFDEGRVRSAAAHAARARALYVPGAGHVQRAEERLSAVARGAEASGEPALAAFALRSLRGSMLETRHALLPLPPELASANEALARVSSAAAPAPSEGGSAAPIRLRLAALEQPQAPRAPWSFALAVLPLLGLGAAWSLLERRRLVSIGTGLTAGVLIAAAVGTAAVSLIV